MIVFNQLPACWQLTESKSHLLYPCTCTLLSRMTEANTSLSSAKFDFVVYFCPTQLRCFQFLTALYIKTLDLTGLYSSWTLLAESASDDKL